MNYILQTEIKMNFGSILCFYTMHKMLHRDQMIYHVVLDFEFRRGFGALDGPGKKRPTGKLVSYGRHGASPGSEPTARLLSMRAVG